jgi:hypothetical protein
MPKFACTCGYVISFVTIPCRYDGYVIRDDGSEAFYDRLTGDLAAFTEALAAGRRDDWIRQQCGENYPLDIGDDAVISDLIGFHECNYVLSIHQCERCGRIWLQDPRRENRYTAFVPEGEWRGALEVPPDGFVGYPDGQDLFGGVLQTVDHTGTTARVLVKMEDGSVRTVGFEGVHFVAWHKQRKGCVRYLSEWTALPPLRRFVFDAQGGGTAEPLLEVTAERMELLGTITGDRNSSRSPS